MAERKYKIVIGIDQSYTCTGVSFLRDGKLLKLIDIEKRKHESNAEFRSRFRDYLTDEINYYCIENDVTVVYEDIRLKSQGHISLSVIVRLSALTSVIVDVCDMFGAPCFSVDTRVCKAAIVDTSKPKKNKYGFPPEKYPTLVYMRNMGLLWEIAEPYEGRGKKGVVMVKYKGSRIRCKLNDNKADAYCISLFGYRYPERLKEGAF